MKILNIDVSELEDIKNKCDYEFIVFQGCGGDIQEWIDGVTKIFVDNNIVDKSFSFKEIYKFQYNGLINLMFDLNDKNIDFGKLAILRLNLRQTFGAMWLSDYIDNNLINKFTI